MKKKFVKPEIKSIRLRLRDNILASSSNIPSGASIVYHQEDGSTSSGQGYFNNNCKSVANANGVLHIYALC